MNDAPKRPPELSLFRDEDELARFIDLTVKTYRDMSKELERMTRDASDVGEAALLNRLAVQTITHKAAKAIDQVLDDTELSKRVDREVELLWPIFKAIVDDELTGSSEITEALRAAARQGKPH